MELQLEATVKALDEAMQQAVTWQTTALRSTVHELSVVAPCMSLVVSGC